MFPCFRMESRIIPLQQAPDKGTENITIPQIEKKIHTGLQGADPLPDQLNSIHHRLGGLIGRHGDDRNWGLA